MTIFTRTRNKIILSNPERVFALTHNSLQRKSYACYFHQPGTIVEASPDPEIDGALESKQEFLIKQTRHSLTNYCSVESRWIMSSRMLRSGIRSEILDLPVPSHHGKEIRKR
jgi:hypothetical protein